MMKRGKITQLFSWTARIFQRWLPGLGIGVLCVLLLSACDTTPDSIQSNDPPARPLPPAISYAEFAERYNQNFLQFERLRARSVISARWTEEDGKNRYEQGEGNFLFVLPDHLAVSLGKAGNVLFWAGTDGKRYWLFDMQGDKSVQFGKVPNADDASVGLNRQYGSPLLVSPADLPMLLGFLPMPEGEGTEFAADPTPVWDENGGRYIVDVPSQGQHQIRMEVDARKLRPKRIAMLDELGQVMVLSDLGRYERLDMIGTPVVDWPTIPTDIRIYQIEPGMDLDDLDRKRNNLRMTLSDLRWNPESIRERLFDLDLLLQVYDPEIIINLDQPRFESATELIVPVPSGEIR